MISSFLEVVSLSALIPFIGVLTQPQKVYDYLLVKGFFEWFYFPNAHSLVLPLTIGFSLAALAAGGFRLLLSWVSIKLTNGIGTDLSIEVYRRTLYQPYKVHVERNSSEIISSITQKIAAATGMLLSLMNVITSSTLFLAILVTLVLIDPIVAIVAMGSFGSCYALIAWKTRRRLLINGHLIAIEQTNVVKALQEGLGAIREVLLDGTQAIYCEEYKKSFMQLQQASGENNYINQAPRFVMEALGMVLIALFAYSLSFREGGIQEALPVLAALALGAQRLLPLLQIMYGNLTVFLGSQASLVEVISLLNQPLPADVDSPVPSPLQLHTEVKFENVSFKYQSNGQWILNDINLIIPKGKRIGFVGSTGSGKSTALDILMSLLEPSTGKVTVDGIILDSKVQRAWQRTIAHVPQHIFLSDATMAENIAFGIIKEDIDMDRVRLAAKQAQIAEFIEASKEGYFSMVGERGVRLSGGQRQRIGIARALYKQAKVLIFDEATSALDHQTEKAVMESIENLNRDLTIIIIAHRISTLENCDLIVKLEKGHIQYQGTYEQFLMEQSEI
jgi:ABC-type bacteriocin/lantibiotic exporter with double-glycine peptidase domain